MNIKKIVSIVFILFYSIFILATPSYAQNVTIYENAMPSYAQNVTVYENETCNLPSCAQTLMIYENKSYNLPVFITNTTVCENKSCNLTVCTQNIVAKNGSYNLSSYENEKSQLSENGGLSLTIQDYYRNSSRPDSYVFPYELHNNGENSVYVKIKAFAENSGTTYNVRDIYVTIYPNEIIYFELYLNSPDMGTYDISISAYSGSNKVASDEATLNVLGTTVYAPSEVSNGESFEAVVRIINPNQDKDFTGSLKFYTKNSDGVVTTTTRNIRVDSGSLSWEFFDNINLPCPESEEFYVLYAEITSEDFVGYGSTITRINNMSKDADITLSSDDISNKMDMYCKVRVHNKETNLFHGIIELNLYKNNTKVEDEIIYTDDISENWEKIVSFGRREAGKYKIEAKLYDDSYNNAIDTHKIDVEVINASDVFLKGKGSKITKSANREIQNMSISLGYMGGKAEKALERTCISAMFSSISSKITNFVGSYVDLGVGKTALSTHLEDTFIPIEIMVESNNSTDFEKKVSNNVQYFMSESVQEERDNISSREEKYKNFVENYNITLTQEQKNRVCDLTEIGANAIDSASSEVKLVNDEDVSNVLPDVLPSGCNIDNVVLQPIDTYNNTISYIDDNSFISAVSLAFAVIISLVVLIIAGLSSVETGGISLVAAGETLKIIKVVVSNIPNGVIILSMILASSTFYFSAVPYVAEEHNATLDAIEYYTGNFDFDHSTSIISQSCTAVDNDTFTVNLEYEKPSSDPLMHVVYSPDGRIIDFIYEEPSALSSTSEMTLNTSYPGKYKVASGTFDNIEKGGMVSSEYTVEEENGPFCTINTGRSVYPVNEAVLITANYTNPTNETLGNLTYFISFGERCGNKTGNLSLSPGESRTVSATFVPTKEGGYVASTFLAYDFIPLDSDESSFVVGNGSAIALDLNANSVYDVGIIPNATLNIQCTGENFTDNIHVETKDAITGKLVYLRTIPYTIPQNFTKSINLALLTTSTPGKYFSYVRYGNRSKFVNYVVSANETYMIIPSTNDTYYNEDETIEVSVRCINSTLYEANICPSLVHVLPDGSKQALSLTKNSTGEYHAEINADLEGTHYLKSSYASTEDKVYAESTFFIVKRSSALLPSEITWEEDSGIMRIKVKSEYGDTVPDATVEVKNSLISSSDSDGIASVYLENYTFGEEIPINITKNGYSPYYGNCNMVEVKPILNADFSSNVTFGRPPMTVQFTDLSDNATAWLWDFDNDGIVDSTMKNPVYTYNSAGVYTVNLTVSCSGVTGTKIKTNFINVSEIYDYPVANFSYEKESGDLPIRVNFTDLSVNATAWSWDFDNDGFVDSTVQNPVYKYTEEGIYAVNLTVTNSHGDSSSLIRQINITPSEITIISS